jgi:hypothetical protein
MKKLLIFVLIGLSCTIAAKADTVQINAAASFGSETFFATLDWDTVAQAVVPGTVQFTALGPLGSFGPVSVFTTLDVFSWYETYGDYFQIDFENDGNVAITPPFFPTISAYNAGDVDLECLSSQCHTDLGLQGFAPGGFFGPAILTITPVATPEPGTVPLLLLSAGMGLLVWLTKHRHCLRLRYHHG